jgi:hypothetical protein
MRLLKDMDKRQESDQIEGRIAFLDMCSDFLGVGHPQTLAAAKDLALALWSAGYGEQAIALLEQALDRVTSTLGPDHAARVDILSTLGEVLLEEYQLERSAAAFREVVDCCIRLEGAMHAATLAAQGDLAVVLFELGQTHEATWLEREALGNARTHLGKTHSITCVLAWNQVLRNRNRGDSEGARKVLLNELIWLLAQDPSSLEADQRTIRTMIVAQFNWDSATVC